MSPWTLSLTLLLVTPEFGAVERAAKGAAKDIVRPEIPAVASVKTGDLIFHTSTSSQALAIAAATASPLTHVGMIRVHGGQAYVIEASSTVQIVPLAQFIHRGRLGRYVILRDPTLSDPERETLWRAAKAMKGKPYDLYFTYDAARVYCSELVWRAYAAIGKTPAEDEEVGDLFVNNAAVDALMKSRWRKHPACIRERSKSLTECFAVAKRERIISPAKIAADTRYTVVESNYPLPWP